MALEIKPKKQFINGKIKYVAIAKRGHVIEWDKVAQQISLVSGANIHQVKSMMSAMTDAIATYVCEGHAVRMDNFGTFMPTVRSHHTDHPEDVSVDTLQITFYPSKKIRQMLKDIDLVK